VPTNAEQACSDAQRHRHVIVIDNGLPVPERPNVCHAYLALTMCRLLFITAVREIP